MSIEANKFEIKDIIPSKFDLVSFVQNTRVGPDPTPPPKKTGCDKVLRSASQSFLKMLDPPFLRDNCVATNRTVLTTIICR